jgi:phosphatidylglycerophosphatase A
MTSTQRTRAAWITGTFFGIGLLGRGGGTYASIVTTCLWLLLVRLLPHPVMFWLTPLAAVLASIAGVWAANTMCRETGKEDPGEVVIDEVAGQLCAFIAAPDSANWKYVLAGLILFRTLDILKPPPVSTLERLHGGMGVMLDDVAAGIITCGILQLLYRWPLSL